MTRSAGDVVNRQTAGVGCFFLAGIVSLVGAVGATLGSVAALSDRLGIDPSAYWNNRLLATSILGMVGLFFTALVTLAGSFLAASRDPGRASAGRLVVGLSALPHVASLVNLLALTPEDWTHTITHAIAVVLIVLGLVTARTPQRSPAAAT